MNSTRARWREALSDLRPWKKGKVRAVHKPLLTLLLIARASRNEPGEVPFSAIADPLAKLLKEFGPSRKSYHPEYPFWHLRNNGFWVVRDADTYPLRTSGSSVSRSVLQERDAVGYVEPDLWRALVADPKLRSELATDILFEFWPETLHPAIREAVGLADEAAAGQEKRKRDPLFRENVLRAYRGECAVCSFDGRLAGNPLGLQAAHVKWHAYGGPDDVSNGLALCAFHHLALDAGALGLSDDRRVVVSCDVSGNNRLEELLYRYEGCRIKAPQPGAPVVAERFIEWHAGQVFKNPGREWPGAAGGASLAADSGRS